MHDAHRENERDDDATPQLREGLDTAIYGLPSFATLRVQNLERSQSWYVDGLGWHPLATMRRPDGMVALIHLRRWRYQDLLLVPAQAPLVRSEGLTLSVAAREEELVDLADRARRVGLGSVTGPVLTPWNTRDLATTDPDGYRLNFTARRAHGVDVKRPGGLMMDVNPWTAQ